MYYIDAKRLKNMLIAGSRWLLRHTELLNELNVYPVPDGDTGTNMSMTLKETEKELKKMGKNVKINEIIEMVSETILLSARGNSGTILSQIISGFLDGIMDKEKVYVKDLAVGLQKAQERAYAAVSNPVEGTILTVVRRVAEEATVFAEKNDELVIFVEHIRKVAEIEVEKTQETLPKLKEAGVVDAGAKGFYFLLEGFEKLIRDGEIAQEIEKTVIERENEFFFGKISEIENIKFSYCTEFIIKSVDFDLEQLREQLQALGDSMVTVQSKKVTKVHIHTNNPGLVLELALAKGELNKIKIDNMAEEHRHLLEETETEKEEIILINEVQNPDLALILVADNKKIGKLFLKAGASAVLLGGQTQNPSVKEIENTIKKVKAKKVYFMPNNGNIIFAAKMAADKLEKEVLVIETKSMLEGYQVLKYKNETLVEIMKSLSRNISIEITKAVRDTKVNKVEIKKGDYLGIVNGKIEKSNKKIEDLIAEMFKEQINKEVMQITVLKGKTATEEADEVIKKYKEDISLEIKNGNQKNYNYYIYLEKRKKEVEEIAIVTDTASELELIDIEGLPIAIIPFKLNVNGEYKKEVEEISKKDMWKYILSSDKIMKTSQPSPGEFYEIYKRLINKGHKKIISIHVSGGLSGINQAAIAAKNIIGDAVPIEIIDTKTASMGVGHIVLEAAKKSKEKEKFNDIVNWVNIMKDKVQVFFSVRNLKYLQKGGRIGKASSMIGGMLKMKPVLKLVDGAPHSEKKALGDKGALIYFEKVIKDELKKGSLIVYNVWGGTDEEYELSLKIYNICKKYDKITVKNMTNMGGILGAHLGPLYGTVLIPRVN
ncbi:MAG: hypothetical protein B6I28_00860 [Fusobacteriia bacterium 4572_132]|nr:MAG: hypothetical protein B6I28_00860 [Fusobacteriia bacterium 4572_132]